MILDRDSEYYGHVLEEAFKYLTSFATERVLKQARSIVKRNKHYRADSLVMCCGSQNHIPRDLADRIEALLKLVKVRKACIRRALTFLPTVIINLMLEYTTCDIPPNRSDSSPQCLIL